jgi:hypothetical protein
MGRCCWPAPAMAKGVTVVDDSTIPDRRGSLTVDDEGTPSQNTTLIEDGVLVGFMQDRQNARLMGMKPTGNGRRQSFAHIPMPRMTNTYMLAGKSDPKEILASVRKGLYAVNFGGGQVDITSGKFVFSAAEAYLIEAGGQGRDADRQRAGRAEEGQHDRQRPRARPRRGNLRQGRPGRAGGRGAADAPDRWAHGRGDGLEAGGRAPPRARHPLPQTTARADRRARGDGSVGTVLAGALDHLVGDG